MAEVKIEDVVYELESEFTKALEDTFETFAPDVSVNKKQVFNFFLKRVYKHCSVWEKVPDKSIKA